MDAYWSVERCRWEPSCPETDALATPWSMWRAEQPPRAEVPEQRHPEPAPAEG